MENPEHIDNGNKASEGMKSYAARQGSYTIHLHGFISVAIDN